MADILANTDSIYADIVLGKQLKRQASRGLIKMALNDPLANVLASIVNYENTGKKEIEVKISSKLNPCPLL